ncbi:MAG: hypothetical protein JWL72_445 [Ilumatobacteraceae bacterium]|nr:hypothetical protein [Ilumatobacteraceae bacterium]
MSIDGAVEMNDVSCATESNCLGIAGGSAETTVDGGLHWTRHSLANGVGTQHVSCPSAIECFTAGDVLSASGAVTALLSSEDGGTTWTQRPLPSGTGSVRYLTCPTATACRVLVGTRVYRTDDAGRTWAWNDLPTSSPEVVQDLECPTAQNCVFIARTTFAAGVARVSSDGGAHWSSSTALQYEPDVISCSPMSCVIGGVMAGGQGTVQTIDLAGAPGPVVAVSEVNDVTAIACSSNHCVGTGRERAADPTLRDRTLISDDGGASWAAAPVGTDRSLVDLACPSSPQCTAVGSERLADGSTVGLAMGTADGGATWTTRPLPQGVDALSSVACPSIERCVATVSEFSSPSRVVASADGGSSWSLATSPPTGIGSRNATCPAVDQCFVTTDVNDPTSSANSAGTLSSSIDGGSTWMLVGQWPGESIADIDCLSRTQCMMIRVRRSAPLQVTVWSTTNGGQHWSDTTPPTMASDVSSIWCDHASTCFAGMSSVTSPTSVQVTHDLGATWTVVGTPNIRAFWGDCGSPTVCLSSSSDGEILTADGGSTWSAVGGPQNRVMSSIACPTAAVCWAVSTVGQTTSLVRADITVTATPTVIAPAYTASVPARLLESRQGLSTVDGLSNGIGRRLNGTTTEVRVTNRAGTPTSATAVALNVTAVDAGAAGYLTVYPCGVDRPNASNVNYGPGATVANTAITQIGTNGNVCIYTNAPTDLIIDINGYFAG